MLNLEVISQIKELAKFGWIPALLAVVVMLLKSWLSQGNLPLSKWWRYKNDLGLLQNVLNNTKESSPEHNKLLRLQSEMTVALLTRDSRPIGEKSARQWDGWSQSARETFAQCRGFFSRNGNFEFTPRKSFRTGFSRAAIVVFAMLVATASSTAGLVLMAYAALTPGLTASNVQFWATISGALFFFFIAYLYIGLVHNIDKFEGFLQFLQPSKN